MRLLSEKGKQRVGVCARAENGTKRQMQECRRKREANDKKDCFHVLEAELGSDSLPLTEPVSCRQLSRPSQKR